MMGLIETARRGDPPLQRSWKEREKRNPEVRIPSQEVAPTRGRGEEHLRIGASDPHNFRHRCRYLRKMFNQLQTEDSVEHAAPKRESPHIGDDPAHSQNPCNIVPLALNTEGLIPTG